MRGKRGSGPQGFEHWPDLAASSQDRDARLFGWARTGFAVVRRMNLRQNQTLHTAIAPAKLNLFLEAFGRREDGFHELESLLVPLRMYDSLSVCSRPPTAIDEAGPIRLKVRQQIRCHGIDDKSTAIPVDSSNLVVRALELLRQSSGCAQGADITLVKRIPIAAGLGGGSSDAAAALRLANRAWDIRWPTERLAELAAELGSDVPFFLHRNIAVCRGRGELIEPVAASKPLHFVLVKPPTGLSTTAVYGELDAIADSNQAPTRPVGSLVDALRRGNASQLGRLMGNRLEAAAARLTSWVDRLRSAFARLDFVGHQLSGSGTTYFGVCRHAQHARRLATILRTQKLGLVYTARSCC